MSAPADLAEPLLAPAPEPRRAPRDRVGIVLSVLGATLAVLALVVFWVLRAQVGRPVYVSELGADLSPGRLAFAIALSMVAAAGVFIGIGVFARDGKAALLVAGALVVAGMGFAVASIFPCTAGCPVPGSSAHTLRDTIHITAAIIGFVMVAVAMLVQALRAPSLAERRIALWSAIAVGVIAGVGGLLALAHVAVAFGALCEFIATTIAILWCASLAMNLHGNRRRSKA